MKEQLINAIMDELKKVDPACATQRLKKILEGLDERALKILRETSND